MNNVFFERQLFLGDLLQGFKVVPIRLKVSFALNHLETFSLFYEAVHICCFDVLEPHLKLSILQVSGVAILHSSKEHGMEIIIR